MAEKLASQLVDQLQSAGVRRIWVAHPVRSRAREAEERVMTSDPEVLSRIQAFVDEEHRLRNARWNDLLGSEAEHRRLQAVEVELDRCWDLLRQRRALRDSGQDPDRASARPGAEVGAYLG